MAVFSETLEIHIHGEVKLASKVKVDQVWMALEPLIKKENVVVEDNRVSDDDLENGIEFDSSLNRLRICWSMIGDSSFQTEIEKVAAALNPLSVEATVLEVTTYDLNTSNQLLWANNQGELLLVYIGPNPSAIDKIKRDTLVQDVLSIMERQFEVEQLSGVFQEIDKLFHSETNQALTTTSKHPHSNKEKLVIFERNSRRLH